MKTCSEINSSQYFEKLKSYLLIKKNLTKHKHFFGCKPQFTMYFVRPGMSFDTFFKKSHAITLTYYLMGHSGPHHRQKTFFHPKTTLFIMKICSVSFKLTAPLTHLSTIHLKIYINSSDFVKSLEQPLSCCKKKWDRI